MPDNQLRTNLGEWQNLPVVQDQVIAYLESMRQPLLLREIYRPLGLPRYTVNRVLARLHTKGFLTRYKIPVQQHRPDSQSRSIVPEAATRQCYLYSLTEDDAGLLV